MGPVRLNRNLTKEEYLAEMEIGLARNQPVRKMVDNFLMYYVSGVWIISVDDTWTVTSADLSQLKARLMVQGKWS